MFKTAGELYFRNRCTNIALPQTHIQKYEEKNRGALLQKSIQNMFKTAGALYSRNIFKQMFLTAGALYPRN